VGLRAGLDTQATRKILSPLPGIKIGNRSFDSVAKIKYLGTTLTDQIVFMKRLRAD
jgi:hypothetical protein